MKRKNPSGKSPLRVIVAPPGFDPPFPVEAVVQEDDTYRLCDPRTEWPEPKESMKALVRAAAKAKPLEPGQVLIRGDAPVQFTAIIYDVNQDPVCQEEWIQLALERISSKVE